MLSLGTVPLSSPEDAMQVYRFQETIRKYCNEKNDLYNKIISFILDDDKIEFDTNEILTMQNIASRLKKYNSILFPNVQEAISKFFNQGKLSFEIISHFSFKSFENLSNANSDFKNLCFTSLNQQYENAKKEHLVKCINKSEAQFSSKEELLAALMQVGTQITQLNLPKLLSQEMQQIENKEYVNNLLQYCPNLTHLSLEGCNFLIASDIHHIFSICPKIIQLNIKGCFHPSINAIIKEIANKVEWLGHGHGYQGRGKGYPFWIVGFKDH